MVEAIYQIYHNKQTNFENAHKLTARLRNQNKSDYIIGLNLVYTSFQMISENINDRRKSDITFRTANAIDVSLGLDNILNNLLNKHIKPIDIINFLRTNLESIAKNSKYKRINEFDISSDYLYNLGANFYYKFGKFDSLGNKIYDGLNEDSLMRKLLTELEINEGRIHKYKNDNIIYEGLIGSIDYIKARIFEREESIMRRQIVKMLGYEVD